MGEVIPQTAVICEDLNAHRLWDWLLGLIWFILNKLTAAHRRLAFGTRVAVRNLKNGHSAHVRINDRGPFVKGRIIDLSEAAARRLGMLQSGLATVQIIGVPN